ncbi:hypothetical protein GGR50DRAFT_678226 [Xylaria sp. CBS 124048]|nr:hypothetical protein GGR50DRAFT_678226 [Xylaria sp. CBS 124048]
MHDSHAHPSLSLHVFARPAGFTAKVLINVLLYIWTLFDMIPSLPSSHLFLFLFLFLRSRVSAFLFFFFFFFFKSTLARRS